MIEFRHICKTFNRGTVNETNALQDINLTIEDSEFIIALGTNGSGKSSLLNALAGTISIDEGEILIDGKDITKLKDFQRSRWIARIFQNPVMGTASELTILENFRLASLRTQSKKFVIGTDGKFIQQVKEKISILNLGLENKTDQQMGKLSGGQRQALALLMAVMDDTKILLMDEPAASLDPRTSELVLSLADKIIKEYKLTALCVTHQLKDALRFGTRIIQMQEGKIVKDISGDKKSELQLSSLYSWYEE
jgi:putative ABC transport system ATP-binding protein